MIRATSGQAAGAQMISATTGAAFTGAVTVYVTIDNGVQAIGSVGAGACTHEGNGYHTYNPASSETDGAVIAFTFVGTGAIPATVQYVTITVAQQSALITSSVSGAVSVLSLCQDAARELNLIMDGEVLSAADGATILRKLRTLLDNWNAQRDAVYAVQVEPFVFTAALNPHTIGPSSATWTTDQRPVSIDYISLLSGDTRTTIWPMTQAQWQALSDPETPSAVPTGFFYNATWPNGAIYFYPVPSDTSSVEIVSRTVLDSALTMGDTLTLPPGYLDAVTLTLTEAIAQAFDRTVASATERLARAARARIFAANDRVPHSITAQGGMPGSSLVAR